MLSVEISADGNWLVYCSSTPATLRQLQIRLFSGLDPQRRLGWSVVVTGLAATVTDPDDIARYEQLLQHLGQHCHGHRHRDQLQIVTGIRIAADNP